MPYPLPLVSGKLAKNPGAFNTASTISLRGQAHSVMPTGMPYGILTKKPHGVTRYDMVLLLNPLTLFFFSLFERWHTLFPIPEPTRYICPLRRATPCYMTFGLGLSRSTFLLSRGRYHLSRQSAHSAPYVCDPWGEPNERPTVTLIWKQFPRKETWFVLRVNFLRILQRTFSGQWRCMGPPLVHVMVCVIYVSFCAPRESQVVWHNSTLSVRSLPRALSPPA